MAILSTSMFTTESPQPDIPYDSLTIGDVYLCKYKVTGGYYQYFFKYCGNKKWAGGHSYSKSTVESPLVPFANALQGNVKSVVLLESFSSGWVVNEITGEVGIGDPPTAQYFWGETTSNKSNKPRKCLNPMKEQTT